MKRKKDWIPKPDAEFDLFFTHYSEVAVENTAGSSPVWRHIPAARVAELSASRATWSAAYEKLKTAHTSGDVLAKQEQRAASEAVLRSFNRQYILDAREVTDAQRRDIGCHVRDAHPTPSSRPEAQPEADIRYPGRHLLELVHIQAVQGTMSDEEAKAGFGVRICWGILGPVNGPDRFHLSAPPETGRDLPHSTFTHRKKHRFDFDGESGNTVYFCLRYENGKGGEDGEGTFGPLFSAIIP